MTDKFWIVGLPRSRTFWLAEFLGCMHEGLYYFPDYDDFLKSDQAGDSTTAYTQIRDFIKNERKIVVHRDIEDVKTSLLAIFGELDFNFLTEAQALMDIETGLHVRFEDIDDRIVEIWHYCWPYRVFPAEKYGQMKDKQLENHILIHETKAMLADIKEAEACLNVLKDSNSQSKSTT